MKTILYPFLSTVVGAFRSRARLHLEILALRQQLAMVHDRGPNRVRFRWRERLFWIWLYRIWPGCLDTPTSFKPDTLIRWHRKGFRLYWTWKSCGGRGSRPRISAEIRQLIRTMSCDNG